MNKVRKYTTEEFNAFAEAVNYWLEQFHLSGWRSEIVQQRLPEETSAATTAYDLVNRQACFQLADERPEGFCQHEDMIALALHEVLHLLVSDLVWTAAKLKDNDEELVISKEHELIHRLAVVLMPPCEELK